MLIFSLFLFSQESDTKNENIRLETKIELLQGTNDDSPIAKFISKRGEGIHHIAFEVSDINSEIERLKSEGFKLINSEAKDGADNKKIFFVHPKSTNGVLVELCQEKSS